MNHTDWIDRLQLEPDVRRVVDTLLRSERLTDKDALILMRRAPLGLLGMLAVHKKEQMSGKWVFYNRNIHIEPTNICLFNCKFCSYRKPAGDPDAWYYDLEQIRAIAGSHKEKPITEVHVVGGVHPDHDLEHYCRMISAVKETLPHVTVKAYTAVELYYIIRKAGLSLEEGLRKLKEAGMTAIPGGGAEIFDPAVRQKICPEKCSAEQWLQTHQVAHGLGISTNATILYGHVETEEQRIDHLRRLRELQDRTGGFNAFIPLKYRSMNNSMAELGEVALPEDMRMMAISRLYLDNFPHVKAYWPMLGIANTELALSFGADDIDGTIDDTTRIYSMAGAEEQKPVLDTERMRRMVREAGYEPVERDTFYNPVN